VRCEVCRHICFCVAVAHQRKEEISQQHKSRKVTYISVDLGSHIRNRKQSERLKNCHQSNDPRSTLPNYVTFKNSKTDVRAYVRVSTMEQSCELEKIIEIESRIVRCTDLKIFAEKYRKKNCSTTHVIEHKVKFNQQINEIQETHNFWPHLVA
jgi:hypothetical protein